MPLMSSLCELSGSGPIALDIETTGLDPYQDELVVISLATSEERVVIDVRGIPRDEVSRWLRERVYPRGILVHNALFDLVFLDVALSCGYPSWYWDTKLVECILTSGLESDGSLASLSRRYLGLELDKSLQTSFDGGALSEDQIAYAELDAAVLHPIAQAQRRAVERLDLQRIVALEHRAGYAFFAMQRNGIGVDSAILREKRLEWEKERDAIGSLLSEELTKYVYSLRLRKHEEQMARLAEWELQLEEYVARWMRLWEAAQYDVEAREEIEAEWVGLALGKSVITREEFESWWSGTKGRNRFEKRVGQRFRQFWPRPSAPKIELDAAINLASPQQLSAALADLFREHGLAVPQDTRSNTLRALMGQHEETDRVIKMLLSWRSYEKLVQFADQIMEAMRDGRIYPDWQQIGAATGRASCRNPNLMAQPKKAGFRRIFVAKRDHVLLSCDYSQIELRIAAALSRDPEMVAAFREGRDLHRFTASRVFGVPEERVTEQQRKVGKQLNFGILYGMGPQRLVAELAAQGIRMQLEEARRAIDSWRETYRAAWDYLEAVREQAVREGYSETALGRKRFYAGEDEASVRRQAGNHPIQGTAADIMKLAMTRLVQFNPVIQVHDEIVLEVPSSRIDEVREKVLSTMIEAAHRVLGDVVPIEADAEYGVAWADGGE
jgi:DNA polymerase I-like protein with 3'-5' exonuclease and polymerase domains